MATYEVKNGHMLVYKGESVREAVDSILNGRQIVVAELLKNGEIIWSGYGKPIESAIVSVEQTRMMEEEMNMKKMCDVEGLDKGDLRGLASLVADRIIFCTKEVLTSDEVARYMGISKSYLYKMTMRREIPHYKPMGKIVYFNRKELEQWLQRKEAYVKTTEEINMEAMGHCLKKEAVWKTKRKETENM